MYFFTPGVIRIAKPVNGVIDKFWKLGEVRLAANLT